MDESVLETAERELREETGAVDFSMERIYDYSVRMVTREKLFEEPFGASVFAKTTTRMDNLYSEIEKT